MGQRRRQLREELERREKGVVNGSGGLGAGGEARVAAAKLDELKKQGDALREKQSRAHSAAWETARASAKKRRASSGSSGLGTSSGSGDGADGLEDRTVRVKWSTKKESHSDHTLHVLFSSFGEVECVSIEEGTGNRAQVTFASASATDAAVAAYRESETMRASHIGKRRPKRSAFAPRRQTMSPMPQRYAAGGGEDATTNSFRDRESLVMMKLRQEAERQDLIRKMAAEEGTAGSGKVGAGIGNAAAAATKAQPGGAGQGHSSSSRGGAGGEGGEGVNSKEPGAGASPEPVGQRAGGSSSGADTQPAGLVREAGVPAAVSDRADSPSQSRSSGGSGASVFPVPSPITPHAGHAVGTRRESEILSAMTNGGAATDSHRESRSSGGSDNKPVFPVPSPVAPRVGHIMGARREGDILSAMMNGGAGSGSRVPNVGLGGSKSVPTTPVSGREARGAVGGALDESDILARMMAMKR